MHARLIFSNKCRRDLRQIQRYIYGTLKSPKAFRNIKSKITKKCILISVTPEAYPYYMRTDANYKKKFRVTTVAKYTIFYKYNKKTDTVTIMRIVYSRRNLGNIVHYIDF